MKFLDFLKRAKKSLIFLACFLGVSFISLGVANGIQNDFGNVEVVENYFEYNNDAVSEPYSGKIYYKLYRPVEATKENKAPGVLMLHGYQNDHETCAGFAIELARRGVAVLAIDEYGHGKTDISMIHRGAVNHKVTVNYGTDVEGETFVSIGGEDRYKVLMNFSNLSFFNEKYSKDNDGNEIYDSSMGGIAAYAVLANYDFVDNTRLGITGHSMGTWASWTVAAAYSQTEIMPKATILQAGELFTKEAYDDFNKNILVNKNQDEIKFNNVLLLTAKYDEFNYFRDYSKQTVNDSVIDDALSCEFLGVSASETEWNKTFGSFSDGTARRRQLIINNHRLVTHDKHSIENAIEWFDNAIGIDTDLELTNHTYLIKENLVFVAMLSGILSAVALVMVLTKIKFFETATQPLPVDRDYRVKKGWPYWKGVLITMGISMITYPFMTQLGHGLLPLPEGIFRMTIGNGFLSWYLILIIIMIITTLISIRGAKKKGQPLDYVDLGLSLESHKEKLDWVLLGKCALLAFLGVLFMYLEVVVAETLFHLDYRYIWPFFKSFNLTRFLQFLVYIPIFALFYLLNNSKIFAQMRPSEATKKGFKGFMSCWYKYALCMVGGVLIIILIEYIPFFMGFGPGMDLLFSPTFGGPFMSLLIVFAPQILVFSFICTYLYRKTGSVYTGAFLVAMLACWIVTGGSAML